MPLFQITAENLRPLDETTFSAAGLRERNDLQRLLRAQIEVIDPDLLVISEEFCEWEGSRCRIDLLAIDRDAKLVVIELKRTDDGGHMELQAIRYAAMVSAMTFEKAVEVYGTYLRLSGSEVDARSEMLSFLGWQTPDESRFGQDVRIVLVSADFSKELTTAVMWLNERELDIRCVRMKPYHNHENVIVEVQKVIPPPAAEDITVKIREKQTRERTARREQTEGKAVCKILDDPARQG